MYKAVAASVGLVAILMMGLSSAVAEPAQQTGSVSGTVMKDGKPVANAKIGLRVAPAKGKRSSKQASPTTQPGADSAKHSKHDLAAQGTSDAEGKFTLQNIGPGQYLVIAGDKAQGRGKVHVVVVSGEDASVVIDLQPPKDKTKKSNKLGL